MRTARAKEWVSKGWQVVPFALVPFLKAPALAKSSERIRVSLLVAVCSFVHAKAHVLGLRMLFVHCEPCDSIAIPYSKASAKSLSPFLRGNEQFPGILPVSP